MKPEFSEILLPPVRVSQGSNSYMENRNSNSGKWLAICAVVFALAVTIITTVIVVRYEDRFTHYERRLIVLEEELDEFYKKFIDDGHSDMLLTDYDLSLDDEDEEPEPEMFGEVHLEEPTTATRSKRQIPIVQSSFPENVPRTADGVPILEGSYSDRSKTGTQIRASVFQTPPPTTESEGLRLYEGLVTSGGRNEPRSLDFSSDPQRDPILPHHRASAAWSEKSESRRGLQVRSGDTSRSSTGPTFSDNIFYTRSTSQRPSSPQENTGSSAGSSASYRSTSGSYSSHQQQHIASLGNNYSPHTSTVHRASRVPNTGDYLYPQNTRARSYQYPPLKKLGQGDGEVVARVLQSENEAESEGPSHATASANFGDGITSHAESTRRRHNGYRRHNPVTSTGTGRRNRPSRNKQEDESDEISIVKAEAWVEGPKTIAAHFVADVSNFTTGHRHYEGNGRLRNQDGIFSSWVPSDWMAGTEMSKAFSISANGILTVKNTGLYYIYAQIHYLDDHDINGYVVQVNTDPFLQCTTMTETQNGGSKSNSCFTAGIKLLKENDRILIKDIETNRYSIFKPEKSFFGLMRIGDTVR